MKTTLQIPDPTFRKATATAGVLGIPLREFVTRAVEEKLSRGRERKGKPWLECAGELAHLHAETVRIEKRNPVTARRTNDHCRECWTVVRYSASESRLPSIMRLSDSN